MVALLVYYCFLIPFIDSINDSFSISLLQIEERPEKDFEKVRSILSITLTMVLSSFFLVGRVCHECTEISYKIHSGAKI